MELAKKFLENIRSDDKVALIYHTDMDGVCSAALVYNIFKKINKKYDKNISIYKSFSGSYDNIENILKETKDYDITIIVDIAFDGEVEPDRKILLIDHHLVKKDMNSKNLVFINPRKENPEIYQPASYLVLKLSQIIADSKDVEYISALGTAGDMGFKDCMDLMGTWTNAKKAEEIFHTKIGQVSHKLWGASYELGIERILDIILETKNLEELEKNEDVKKSFRIFNKEFEKGKEQFWNNSETFGNVIFSKIKPHYKRLGSPIINSISFEKPEKIIFLLEDREDVYKISVRYQNVRNHENLHLGILMKECCNGGGHRPAAGGSIKKEGYEVFKKRILTYLKKFSF